jgi:hypothetical protein
LRSGPKAVEIAKTENPRIRPTTTLKKVWLVARVPSKAAATMKPTIVTNVMMRVAEPNLEAMTQFRGFGNEKKTPG